MDFGAGAEKIASIASYLDVSAPPPAEPTALFIFGTRQASVPAGVAAGRHRRGFAPMVIITGGTNRRTGEHEARTIWEELRRRGCRRP